MSKRKFLTSLSIALMVAACGPEAQPIESTASYFDLLETPVGDVDFPVGCGAEAATLVERGVALLHHMMYEEANFVFGMADDKDPDCAMAYWGQAMALIHPLWPDIPSATEHERGAGFFDKARTLGGHSEREDGYIETVGAYFDDTAALTERERLLRFEASWKSLTAAYPEDLEARSFYSLALRATAGAGGRDLSIQEKAGAIAESVLADMPNHPGAHHYIIHAYDFPELAAKGSAVADDYGKITPHVPHATHMMTHIYTRLGEWNKAITWNTISADTAWALCLSTGEINLHYTHALDYLAYAYLQIGEDEAVLDILNTAKELQPPYSEVLRDASAYAFAAIPARYALERQDWEAAAQLKPRMPDSFPWEERFNRYVAITHFARAIGLARLGNANAVDDEVQALEALRQTVVEDSPYWALQIDIQIETARAWQAYASSDVEAALVLMQHAAELEMSTNKHPLTPGEILPATELHGDLLLEAGRFEEAHEAYRVAMSRSPRRYNSLYGAGKAASELGDEDLAKTYFSELISMAGAAKTARPAIDEARRYLERG
jgi:tetratricopeptide (TPR) repeat protein